MLGSGLVFRGIAATVFCGVLMMGGSSVIGAQRGTPGTSEPIVPASTTPTGEVSPLEAPDAAEGGFRARMAEQRVKTLNDSRHERLEQDVDKLLALTNELKADVDKTKKDELSLDVIKKAGEIEKLAHDVQSRMKN